MDTLNLSKGQSLNLTKGGAPTGAALLLIAIGMGWELVAGNAFDLDVSIVPSKKGVVDGDNICFFNREETYGGAITHGGDNLTGSTGGDEADARKDDEQIFIDLSKLPEDVDALTVVVNIYNANGKTFGDLEKAYIRVCDYDGTNVGEENFFHDLDENLPSNNGCIVASFTKAEDGWHMTILDKGIDGDLNTIASAVPAALAAGATA